MTGPRNNHCTAPSTFQRSPQIPRRNRPIRPPGFGDTRQQSFRSALFAVEQSRRALQAGVADGEHVEALEAEDAETFRRSSGRCRAFAERFNHRLVIFADDFNRKPIGRRTRGRRARGCSGLWLADKPAARNCSGGTLQETCPAQTAAGSSAAEPLLDRRGGFGGKLLADDRIGEHVKRLETRARRADSGHVGDQPLHDRIGSGQMTLGFADRRSSLSCHSAWSSVHGTFTVTNTEFPSNAALAAR